jgi:hypothetical protein
MSDAPPLRLAAATGLALAAAVALWWLGSTRIALDRGSDAAAASAAALHAAWLVRGVAVVVIGLRIGALRGWRAGAASALGIVAPMWPLLVPAWSASTAPLPPLLLSEALLLVACAVVPLAGTGLRRLLRRADAAELAATAIGCTLATAIWWSPGPWAAPAF